MTRPTNTVELELMPVARAAWRSAALISVFVALAAMVFPVVAGLSGVQALMVSLPLALAAIALTVGTITHNKALIEGDTLRLIGGTLFRARVPLAELNLDDVDLVYPPRDVREHIGLRLFGTALPPYAAGWYRARSDARRAFVIAPSAAPLLRIGAGQREVILAVANPQQALAKLRDAALAVQTDL